MKLQELTDAIAHHPAIDSVHVVLPDNQVLPPHFHLTEIGKVSKDFIQLRRAGKKPTRIGQKR